MLGNSRHKLKELAEAIRIRNAAEAKISQIIGRPGLIGHAGEYIAAIIFRIELQQSASHKAYDGRFVEGELRGKNVDIKWYPKMEGLLDISQSILPDFYLALTGPKAPAISSRGSKRPWLISQVYLFDAKELVNQLRQRGIKIGIATSVANHLWEAAEIYPLQRSNRLMLSDEQKELLALFGKSP